METHAGILKGVPYEGRSVCVARDALNMRECSARNQESGMDFLKEVQACSL